MSNSEPRRNRALELVRRQLSRQGSPYFILFMVLAATGLAGFLASVLLLSAGLTNMAIRYPICVALAYLVFFFQLYLYVLYQRNRRTGALVGEVLGEAAVDTSAEAAADAVDIALASGAPAPPAPPPTSTWDWFSGLKLGESSSGGGSDSDDAVSGLAAVLVVLVLGVLVVLAVGAALAIVAEAPILLAEVLVDGVLMVGLGSRVRSAGRTDWVFSVLRRTMVPAFFVALAFCLGGAALQTLVPGATTMGQVLHRLWS